MRYFWIALFCIMFTVSGSLIAAAHTIAHAQSSEIAELDIVDGQQYYHDLQIDEHHDDDFADHHKQTDHADHGAELHLTALGLSAMSAEVHLPDRALLSAYLNLQYPAPLLPPDPDPDRA